MSRFLTQKDDGSWVEEIESMHECRWRINEVCCNEVSTYLGDSFCYSDEKRYCFEKEDGIIDK